MQRIRWRGFELPTRVVLDPDTRTDTYSRFTAEPFERGFGTTLGNSLRRVLLSSLEGASVSSIKFEKGVKHEFQTLPGIFEDITDIVLNVKKVLVRLQGDEPQIVRVRREKKGVVKSGDIETGPRVEIVNPDLVLATLTEDVEFGMELTIRRGRGYTTAAENASPEEAIGVIPIDSIFSPVVKVAYHTEPTRIGQIMDYDRLILEIWTNGVMSPDLALVEAAKILRKHLNPFVFYFDAGKSLLPPAGEGGLGLPAPGTAEMDALLSQPVSSLRLSVRASNCLDSENVKTIGDLVAKSEEELLNIRNFGKTSLKEISDRLAERGFSLGMKSDKAGE
ncbi:MAG: DNA-directed RNA polymerase subunit alpha [Planctomycetota bacterium]